MKKEESAEELLEKASIKTPVNEEEIRKKIDKINTEQVYNMLTNNELSWQAIIYDLINTEQLDPLDIDLALIAKKYLEKIRQLEETNFFISSKVLLAASLLLRIKSEILLEKYIRSLDDILFGRKQEEKREIERIELDEDIPGLYARTPIPRMRKVSLSELMSALSKAIKTENRRIEKEINVKIAERETDIVFPKTKINIKDRIRKIYSRILTLFKHKNEKMSYTELVGNSKEDKIAGFLPVLHLENQQKVWLEQEKHFSEIYVWMYDHYKFENPETKLNYDVLEEIEELEEKEIEEIEREEEISNKTGFGNPVDDLIEDEL